MMLSNKLNHGDETKNEIKEGKGIKSKWFMPTEKNINEGKRRERKEECKNETKKIKTKYGFNSG